MKDKVISLPCQYLKFYISCDVAECTNKDSLHYHDIVLLPDKVVKHCQHYKEKEHGHS
jgi:hypothetical protein